MRPPAATHAGPRRSWSPGLPSEQWLHHYGYGQLETEGFIACALDSPTPPPQKTQKTESRFGFLARCVVMRNG